MNYMRPNPALAGATFDYKTSYSELCTGLSAIMLICDYCLIWITATTGANKTKERVGSRRLMRVVAWLVSAT